MKNYQKAIRYATKLIKNWNAPYNPKDLVHDSFLQWNEYQDSNLFDNEEGKIMKVVKNMHFNNLRGGYSQKGTKEDVKEKKQELIKREFIPIANDANVGYGKRGDKQGVNYYTPKNEINPENILISKENHENLNNFLCIFDKKVLDLRIQGYSNSEIEKILNTHNVKITKSIKNIKKQMHTKSPFSGCNVIVIERVRRKTFESKKEKYLEDWEMGENSDYNEFYILMTSKTNPLEGLLIKEKDSD